MAVKHPSVSVSCLLCMWRDWKKHKSYENGTECLVLLFPFFTAYEFSFWFRAVMLSPCQQEGARAMVAACPLIANTEKRQLGCTEAHRYRCTAWRGFKKNLIHFCFFLALAHLPWCWDLVLEPQALLVPLFQMPEGGVVQSLKTWGVIQEWAEVEETHIRSCCAVLHGGLHFLFPPVGSCGAFVQEHAVSLPKRRVPMLR